ncbi:hypothetical protein [Gleimia europaea]|nr:hypothetical protein [Gleimia europaea]MDP9835176.1 hypothetical protein [Gleimia europaea]
MSDVNPWTGSPVVSTQWIPRFGLGACGWCLSNRRDAVKGLE